MYLPVSSQIRLRFSYPSEWVPHTWEARYLKSKLKVANLWAEFASQFANKSADMTLAKTLECKCVQLALSAKVVVEVVIDLAELILCML